MDQNSLLAELRGIVETVTDVATADALFFALEHAGFRVTEMDNDAGPHIRIEKKT